MVSLLLFPGQGAQKLGMGQDLAEAFPAARAVFAAIDDALDMSLSRMMWEGPEDELQRTDLTQPAILAHSAAVLAVARERLEPVAGAAGHSLGEYSAYVAAGALEAVRAAQGLAAELAAAPFQDPAFPVVANATAEPVRSSGQARRLLVEQLTAPVRWVECVRALAGAAPEGASRFVELGPGTVLGGLLKR